MVANMPATCDYCGNAPVATDYGACAECAAAHGENTSGPAMTVVDDAAWRDAPEPAGQMAFEEYEAYLRGFLK